MNSKLSIFIVLIFTHQIHGMLIQTLPQELNQEILTIIAIKTPHTTLQEAAKAINTLAHVNRSLHKFINNKERTLVWIKSLAEKYDVCDMKVTRKLQTKAANYRFLRAYP